MKAFAVGELKMSRGEVDGELPFLFQVLKACNSAIPWK